jgi:hypothetical protein
VIPTFYAVIASVASGGGGRCRAMVKTGACLNAARWTARTLGGVDLPVCRLHGNKALRPRVMRFWSDGGSHG